MRDKTISRVLARLAVAAAFPYSAVAGEYANARFSFFTMNLAWKF